MADIFISYSKADRDLALKLSAYLESEGWSVWWDKSLGAGDAYRDEIMKQLASARAVIVIWTENSIKSDWVRAEAGRAKADGKLIPAKTPSLTYADIPLPFGEMHTENITSLDLIRAAVLGQLSKLAAPVSLFNEIKGLLKYNVFSWIGIIGGAITLFGNLKGVLSLSDWAKMIVERWDEWNRLWWQFALSWIDIRIPPQLVPYYSFSLFTLLLIIGVTLSATKEERRATLYRHVQAAEPTILRQLLFILVVFAEFSVVGCIGFFVSATAASVVAFAVICLMTLFFSPSKDRPWYMIAWVLGSLCAVLLVGVPLIRQGMFDEFALQPVGMLMVAIICSPVKALVRRLSYLVIGMFLLLVLNQTSKLHLFQYLSPA